MGVATETHKRYNVYNVDGDLHLTNKPINGFDLVFATDKNYELTEFIQTWNAYKLVDRDPVKWKASEDVTHPLRYGIGYNEEENKIDTPHKRSALVAYPNGISGGGYKLITKSFYTDGVIGAFDAYAKKVYPKIHSYPYENIGLKVEQLKALFLVFLNAISKQDVFTKE